MVFCHPEGLYRDLRYPRSELGPLVFVDMLVEASYRSDIAEPSVPSTVYFSRRVEVSDQVMIVHLCASFGVHQQLEVLTASFLIDCKRTFSLGHGVAT